MFKDYHTIFMRCMEFAVGIGITKLLTCNPKILLTYEGVFYRACEV